MDYKKSIVRAGLIQGTLVEKVEFGVNVAILKIELTALAGRSSYYVMQSHTENLERKGRDDLWTDGPEK